MQTVGTRAVIMDIYLRTRSYPNSFHLPIEGVGVGLGGSCGVYTNRGRVFYFSWPIFLEAGGSGILHVGFYM